MILLFSGYCQFINRLFRFYRGLSLEFYLFLLGMASALFFAVCKFKHNMFVLTTYAFFLSFSFARTSPPTIHKSF